jgi:hypothetical protein
MGTASSRQSRFLVSLPKIFDEVIPTMGKMYRLA